LFGLFIGPTAVGLITDLIFGDAANVRYSLAIMVSLPVPIMFVLMVIAWRPYRQLRGATD
jgi:hypothetical protein